MFSGFRLHLLFHIPGFLIQKARTESILAISDGRLSLETRLVVPGDGAIRELEEAVAFRNMVLDGSLGESPEKCTFDARLASAIERNWGVWQGIHGVGPYTLFTIRGNHVTPTVEQFRELNQTVLGWGENRKDQVREEALPMVRAVIAGLHLVCPEIHEATEIHSQIVYSSAEGKVFHIMTTKFGANGTVVRALDDSALERASHLATRFIEEPKLFGTPMRLLVGSLDGDADSHRAFQSAWTALETLVGKGFSRLSDIQKEDLVARVPTQPPRPAPTNRQFPLADKFALLAEDLFPERRSSLCSDFKVVKDSRDDLTHGDEVSDAAASTRMARSILSAIVEAYPRPVVPSKNGS